jgi:hypothetical protein
VLNLGHAGGHELAIEIARGDELAVPLEELARVHAAGLQACFT